MTGPVIVSIKTALAAVSIIFIAGTAMAYGVHKIRIRLLCIVIDAMMMLPLVLPPTVTGFLLISVFGAQRPVGLFLEQTFGLRVVFTWGAAVVAAVVVALPLMYRAARGAFEQADDGLIQAARTLGMREAAIFFKILLPLSAPGLVTGLILAGGRALGEFGATVMIAGNIAGKTQTLPLAVYSAVAAGHMEQAWRWAAILLVVSFFSVVAVGVLTLKAGRR
jgi:molybdate transport system permease protein